MIDASELTSCTYISIFSSMMHIESFGHVAYIWYLRGIFVAGTYMAIAWYTKPHFVVYITNMYSTVGSICRVL